MSITACAHFILSWNLAFGVVRVLIIRAGHPVVSSFHPQVFPMAEVVNPYTLPQDEPAGLQFEDPEKSSETEEKVYDSG